MQAADFVKMYDGLEATKGNLNIQFEDIQKFVTPNDPTVIGRNNTPGQRHHVGRYDSTAIKDADLLAATLHGTMTPSTTAWIEFRTKDEELNELDDVKEWLDDAASKTLKALNASNFKTQIYRCYRNLVGYATTSLLTTEKFDENGDHDGVSFSSFAIREYNFTVDAEGNLKSFYRKFKLTASQARDKFSGMAGFKSLGTKIQDALESKKPEDQNKKFGILHIIYPREHFGEGKSNLVNKPVVSRYVACDDKHDISVGGFDEMPVTVARWDVAEDDMGWGRGPGWVALPEIKTLNRNKELALKGFAKDVSPPLIVPHKGVIGGVKTGPNATTFYNAAKTHGQKPEYLHSGTRWDVNENREANLIRQIDEIFLVDKLQLPQDQDMTATEVTVRFDLLQRLLGPTFFRITKELLDNPVTRTFNMLLRAGKLKDLPKSLEGLAELEIVYIGPLAKAQKQDEVNSVRTIIQEAGAMAQVTQDPSILDKIDFDQAIDLLADQGGVPAKVMRDLDDVEAMRENRNAQIQEQQQIDQLQQAGQIEATAAQAENEAA